MKFLKQLILGLFLMGIGSCFLYYTPNKEISYGDPVVSTLKRRGRVISQTNTTYGLFDMFYDKFIVSVLGVGFIIGGGMVIKNWDKED